jgi:hypothetical protein
MKNENNLTKEEIKQLEQQFHAEKRKFSQYNKEYLGTILTKDDGISNVQSLLSFSTQNNDEGTMEDVLTIDTFKFVGGILDILGLDFTSQSYMNKEICRKVRERLNELGFEFSKDNNNAKFDLIDSRYIMESVIDFVHKTDFTVFHKAFEKLAKCIDKEIKNDNQKMQSIFYNIKKLLKHCSMNISLIVDLDNILNHRHEITYRDILKINSTISEHAHYNGQSAFHAYRQIYAGTEFPNLLNRAVELYDLSRYAHIFIENIISLKEIIGVKFTLSDIQYMMFGNLDDICWDESKDKFENQLKENRKLADAEKEKSIQNQVVEKYAETFDDIMAKDPIQSLMIIAHESLGEEMKTVENVIEGWEKVCNSDDYLADIYKYVKARHSTITGDETLGEYNFDPKEIINKLNKKIGEIQSEYKHIAEIICQSLTTEQARTLNNYVNNVIGYLVLDNPQNRVYILSQFYDPKLTTIQHCIQIMNLIERCTILTKEEAILAYVKLYKYTIDNFKSAIEEVSKSEPLVNKISFFMGVKQIFEKWIENKSKQ